jgi:hypothetical protein
LILRPDNADLRLTKKGYPPVPSIAFLDFRFGFFLLPGFDVGCVSEERVHLACDMEEKLTNAISAMK